MSSVKNEIRARLRAERNALNPGRLSQLNSALGRNLRALLTEALSPNKGDVWAGYRGFGNEADPYETIVESQGGVRWVFPRVEGNTLRFYEPPQTNAKWTKSSYGIWEPDSKTSTQREIHDFAGILIPGLAFDRNGQRLGFGKGYYDRALAGFKGLKVGVGFQFQLLKELIPVEPHDVALDFVATDQEIHRVRSMKKDERL